MTQIINESQSHVFISPQHSYQKRLASVLWRDIHTQSLETLSKSSSKASKELQEFQPSNTKNIRSKIIQIILLDLKVH